MSNLTQVVELLRKLKPDFYGQIIIRIRHGEAVHITKEESIKLEDKPNNRL